MFIRAASFALLAVFAVHAQQPDDSIAKLAKEGHWEEELWSAHNAIIGKPYPKFDLHGWMNGQVTPEDMKGKIVIVDFWATWCGPCIKAIPHNNEMAEKYADKGVILIGICGSGKGLEKMPELVRKHEITYPVAFPDKGVEEAWRVSWFPTYAVIDGQGIVRALGIKPDYVEKVVDALLEKKKEKK